MTETPDLRTATEIEADANAEEARANLEPEHDDGYDNDVWDVYELEPDFTAEETEEVYEDVQDEGVGT